MACLFKFILFLSVVLPRVALAQIRINEVMSSNGTTIADDEGDFEDWIELYNAGEEAVDLSGWGLSDSYANPFKWTFPEGSSIGLDGYLLVWASGKDLAKWRNLGWWRMTAMHGGVTPEEVYGESPGSLQGAVVLVDDLEGFSGLDFASSGHVDLAQPARLSGDFTVGYWFYTRRANTWRALNSSESVGLSLGHWNANTIGFFSHSLSIPLSQSFQSGSWEHLLVTRHGQEVTVYRNGQPVGEGQWSGTLEIDRLGGISPGTAWSGFDGLLRDVLLLSYAMDPNEIQAMLNEGFQLRTPEIHTNFLISSSGEDVILPTPGGIRMDELPPTFIPRDVSIGRIPGEDPAWFFF